MAIGHIHQYPSTNHGLGMKNVAMQGAEESVHRAGVDKEKEVVPSACRQTFGVPLLLYRPLKNAPLEAIQYLPAWYRVTAVQHKQIREAESL